MDRGEDMKIIDWKYISIEDDNTIEIICMDNGKKFKGFLQSGEEE